MEIFDALVAGFATGKSRPIPGGCLVHELIRDKALADPEGLAVDGPLGRLTRGGLEARASALRVSPLRSYLGW